MGPRTRRRGLVGDHEHGKSSYASEDLVQPNCVQSSSTLVRSLCKFGALRLTASLCTFVAHVILGLPLFFFRHGPKKVETELCSLVKGWGSKDSSDLPFPLVKAAHGTETQR